MGILASRGIEYEDSYRSFSEKERQQLLSLFERLATDNEHGIMKIEFEPFKVSFMTNKKERSVVRSTVFCVRYLLNDERKHETAILTLFKVSSSANAGVNLKPMVLCYLRQTSCFSLLYDSFLYF